MVYPIAKRTLVQFVRLYIRKIKGINNIPIKRGMIIACNHSSFADDLLLPCTIIPHLNKKLHIYVNSMFFKNPILRNFLYWGGCIPVDVGRRKKSEKTNIKAFKTAINFLKKDEIMGIFPEGHRSYDQKLREGKTGVAKLALSAQVPIIPVGIRGSSVILPKGAYCLRFKRCEVIIGKPMYFEKYYKQQNNKKVLKEVTHKIMQEISKLSNFPYPYKI